MNSETFLIWLIVGTVAGWFAGVMIKGYGFGTIGNIVVGIVGAAFGGWLVTHLGVAVETGFLSAAVGAVAGAAVLLLILRLVRRAT